MSASVFTPGSARLASPVSVPPGLSSTSAVTPVLLEGLHAQVPADRVGDLSDQPGDDLCAGGDRVAVGVGNVTHGRVGDREVPDGRAQLLHGRGHVVRVERAGHLQRDDPAYALRLVGLQGGDLGRGAGGDDLAAPVDVGGGQAELLQVRDRDGGVAAEQGGHTGLGDRGGLGHAEPPGTDEAECRLVTDDTGDRGGGDLTDAVTRDDVGGGRVQGRGREQAGGDQERLGDGRVADLVRVGLRAVVGKVEPDGVGPGRDAVGGTGEVEPGSQEAGRLSALAGSDEYEHPHTLSCGRLRTPVGTGTKNRQGNC